MVNRTSWQTLLTGCMFSVLLTGCATSPEDQAKIDSVVTALPTEVTQCTFLGDVATTSFTLPSAREDLKLQTAELGGNHLVETSVNAVNSPAFGYGFRGEPYFYGMDTTFYLSGRAYFCSPGTGVVRPLQQSSPVKMVDQIIPKQPLSYKQSEHLGQSESTNQSELPKQSVLSQQPLSSSDSAVKASTLSSSDSAVKASPLSSSDSATKASSLNSSDSATKASTLNSSASAATTAPAAYGALQIK